MKVDVRKFTASALVCALALCGHLLNAQEKTGSTSVPVHLVITDVGLKADAELPRLRQDEVKVKQGKTFLQVTLATREDSNGSLKLRDPGPR